jgi:putative copper export protein
VPAPAAWRLAALATVGVVATPAWLGHAAADETSRLLAVAADTLHVASAGAWLGTLAVLVGSASPRSRTPPRPGRTPLLLALARAFSPVALVAVSALGLSGVVSTALRLAPAWPGGLRWPVLGAYGWVLGAKLAAVVPTALLGLWHWRRAVPPAGGRAADATDSPRPTADLDDGPFAALSPSPRRLARSMTAEVALAALVLLATALLVATPPPAPPDDAGATAPAAEP